MPLTVPHRRPQRRIQRLELLLIHLQQVLKGSELDVRGQRHFLKLDLGVGLDGTEIFFGVVVDLEGRKK